MSRVRYSLPSISELEVRYATDAVENGWGAHCYTYVERFEQGFREHLGTRHAIATSSCTGAMTLGLDALGIGRGGEVILGEINWIATVAPVVHLGATPVIVDVLPDSWCLDPERVEAAITPRTRAIVATHVYGNLCAMDALLDIGARHGIPVIEDAAEAIGSSWYGRAAGSLGRFGTFSFHGTKVLTTGEGGMFVSSDDELAERVATLANHGRRAGESRQFWPSAFGYKFKMSNVQAAIGCAQLERVDALVGAKRRVFEAYAERLAGLPLVLNPEPPGTRNGYWMPTIVVDADVPFDRERALREFAAADIDARVFFWPLTMLPMFERQPEHVVAYSVHQRGLNLPSHPTLGDDEIDRVVDCLCACLRRSPNRVAVAR